MSELDFGKFYRFLATKDSGQGWDKYIDNNYGKKTDGVVIKAEFRAFMEAEWDWNGTGFDAESADGRDLINSFWAEIDNMVSGKIKTEIGTTLNDNMGLNDKEVDAVNKEVGIYTELNKFLAKITAPNTITNDEIRKKWKKSVADDLTKALANWDRIGNIETYLNSVYPEIANKNTAIYYAQDKTASLKKTQQFLRELNNKIGYDITMDEELQARIEAYVATVNAETQDVEAGVNQVINEYLAEAGYVYNEETRTYTKQDAVDGDAGNRTWYEMTPLQEAVVTKKVNEALAEKLANYKKYPELVNAAIELFIELDMPNLTFNELNDTELIQSKFEESEAFTNLDKSVQIYERYYNLGEGNEFYETLVATYGKDVADIIASDPEFQAEYQEIIEDLLKEVLAGNLTIDEAAQRAPRVRDGFTTIDGELDPITGPVIPPVTTETEETDETDETSVTGEPKTTPEVEDLGSTATLGEVDTYVIDRLNYYYNEIVRDHLMAGNDIAELKAQYEKMVAVTKQITNAAERLDEQRQNAVYYLDAICNNIEGGKAIVENKLGSDYAEAILKMSTEAEIARAIEEVTRALEVQATIKNISASSYNWSNTETTLKVNAGESVNATYAITGYKEDGANKELPEGVTISYSVDPKTTGNGTKIEIDSTTGKVTITGGNISEEISMTVTANINGVEVSKTVNVSVKTKPTLADMKEEFDAYRLYQNTSREEVSGGSFEGITDGKSNLVEAISSEIDTIASTYSSEFAHLGITDAILKAQNATKNYYQAMINAISGLNEYVRQDIASGKVENNPNQASNFTYYNPITQQDVQTSATYQLVLIKNEEISGQIDKAEAKFDASSTNAGIYIIVDADRKNKPNSMKSSYDKHAIEDKFREFLFQALK